MSTPTDPRGEAAHTPGPRISDKLIPRMCGFARKGCVVLEDESGREIALVWDFEQAEERANLLAAAPALLAALEAIIAYRTPLPAGLLEQARAALLQAKGGTR